MVKKTSEIPLCKQCGCPTKEVEETLRPFLMEGKAQKFKFMVCENFTVSDICEKCSSKMLLRTLTTTPKNPSQGHIRMLFCTNAKCNNRKHRLKRTPLSCPRCGSEVVEMSGMGGLFVYGCLGNRSAQKAHGVASDDSSAPGDRGCMFFYRGDLLVDGPDHQPVSECPQCSQPLTLKSTETEESIDVEIVCSSCNYKHVSKAEPRRAVKLKG